MNWVLAERIADERTSEIASQMMPTTPAEIAMSADRHRHIDEQTKVTPLDVAADAVCAARARRLIHGDRVSPQRLRYWFRIRLNWVRESHSGPYSDKERAIRSQIAKLDEKQRVCDAPPTQAEWVATRDRNAAESAALMASRLRSGETT